MFPSLFRYTLESISFPGDSLEGSVTFHMEDSLLFPNSVPFCQLSVLEMLLSDEHEYDMKSLSEASLNKVLPHAAYLRRESFIV